MLALNTQNTKQKQPGWGDEEVAKFLITTPHEDRVNTREYVQFQGDLSPKSETIS